MRGCVREWLNSSSARVQHLGGCCGRGMCATRILVCPTSLSVILQSVSCTLGTASHLHGKLCNTCNILPSCLHGCLPARLSSTNCAVPHTPHTRVTSEHLLACLLATGCLSAGYCLLHSHCCVPCCCCRTAGLQGRAPHRRAAARPGCCAPAPARRIRPGRAHGAPAGAPDH